MFFISGIAYSGVLGTLNDTIVPLPQLNKKFEIVVHVVTDSTANNDVLISDIYSTIEGLNDVFEPISVSFDTFAVNFIYNDVRYLDPDDTDRKEMIVENWLPKRINVFYVDTIPDKPEVCGFATLEGVSADLPSKPIVFMRKEDCNSISVLAHEIGHFFGLKHTFEGSGIENANGDNSSTAGDLVTDTPADPYNANEETSSYVNDDCEFINTDKDANGDYYDPDVSNLMSYYGNCYCLKFTEGQYRRMVSFYNTNKFLW